MKISVKALLVFVLAVVVLMLTQNDRIIAQSDEGFELNTLHMPGELRKVTISKVMTQNVIKNVEEPENTESKVIIYDQNFEETCVKADDTGDVERMLLKVVKSRRKVGVKQDDEHSKVQKDPDEGKSSVLSGDELSKYRKMQPDFGLILPTQKISVGDTWKPDETQMKQLFDKKIQEGNSVAYKLVNLKTDKTTKSTLAEIERNLDLKFIVPGKGDKIESTGIEKSRTTYVFDVDNKRLVSISEAQVLIMKVTDNDKSQILMKVATETKYEYAKIEMHTISIIPEVGVEQTECAFTNFDLKLLITTKKEGKQLVTSNSSESDRILRRTATKVENGEAPEYILSCDYDRTIKTDVNVAGKKTVNVSTSELEGKTYRIHSSAEGVKKILDADENDVTDKVTLPQTNNTGIKLKFPEYAIPVGYLWSVENDAALGFLRSMFASIEVNSIFAQIEFTRVLSDETHESIAEFRLDIAVTGTTKEYGKLIFAISVYNHVDIKHKRILRTFTQSAKKDDFVLRLRFENEDMTVDGIGTMIIDTKYQYSIEKTAFSLAGGWFLTDRKTGEVKKDYKLTFNQSGLILFDHPNISGEDTISDKGIWRVEKDVLTVKISGKKDIFQFKIETNEMTLTKLIKTDDSTSIFPWRVNQSDKYVKADD